MFSEKDIEKLLESRVLSSCEDVFSIPKDFYYFKFSKRINTSIDYSELPEEEIKEYQNRIWFKKDVDEELVNNKIPFMDSRLPSSDYICCWFTDPKNNSLLKEKYLR